VSYITEDEFRSAVAETKLSDRTRQAAHRVLVNGWTRRAAGESAGRTTQWASQAAARVVEAHRGLMGCPAGWEIVTVRLPVEDAVDVRELERDRLDALESSRNP
jgi:hypothetical protein